MCSISLTFCCTLKLFGNSLYTILSYLFSFILFIQYRINQTKQWHPTPVLLPGKPHGRRSLVGCSPWGHKESDMTERLHFHFSLSCIGEGNGTPLHYSSLGESQGWGSPVGCRLWGCTESDMTEAT